jgi:structural maintenance of chromosome 4
VLQGEVESISMMKPKGENENEEGLLEYLEDLIGSNVYKEPIADKARELDALNEEKQDKLNKVKAASKDKDALEPAMREAVQYIQLSNELTRLKNKRWQHFLEVSTREAEQCKAEKEVLAGKLQSHQQEQAAREAEVGALSGSYEKEKKEYKRLEAAVQKAKDDFTAFERKDAKFREELKHAKSKLKKMAKQLDEERHQVNQLTAQAQNDQADIDRLTQDIDADQKRLVCAQCSQVASPRLE